MTELEIVTFVVLPLGVALFGWLVVLMRERRARKAISGPTSGRRS